MSLRKSVNIRTNKFLFHISSNFLSSLTKWLRNRERWFLKAHLQFKSRRRDKDESERLGFFFFDGNIDGYGYFLHLKEKMRWVPSRSFSRRRRINLKRVAAAWQIDDARCLLISLLTRSIEYNILLNKKLQIMMRRDETRRAWLVQQDRYRLDSAATNLPKFFSFFKNLDLRKFKLWLSSASCVLFWEAREELVHWKIQRYIYQ